MHTANNIREKEPPRSIGAYIEQGKVHCLLSHKNRGCRALGKSCKRCNYPLACSNPAFVDLKRIHFARQDIGRLAVIEKNSGGLDVMLEHGSRNWRLLDSLSGEQYSSAVPVPEYQIDGKYLMYLGGPVITTASSFNGKDWQSDENNIPDLAAGKNELLVVDLAEKVQAGILLCYRNVRNNKEGEGHQVHLALLDATIPNRILWRSETPVWESEPGENDVGGAAVFRSRIFAFWNSKNNGVSLVRYPFAGLPFELPRDETLSLERALPNPIVYPRANMPWESFATYNPAAFYADGRVHILYRAQGHDLISSIGYASSADGIHIDERLDKPVYRPQQVFDSPKKSASRKTAAMYMSGGGVAGCEDPRATVVGEKLYMTYVAFDGVSPPRVALTSIQLNDFLAKRWQWSRPVMISPPGIVDKSAVIFPEKVCGKYVVMHRIFPDILIDYETNLNFDGSRWLKADDRIPVRPGMWDSRKIGAGAPPIKTAEGWLLIYYGVDDRDDRQYKMGAMLLDLHDPARVLYRSASPILEPSEWYENSGFKPGVVYPCGAVLQRGKLFVYYGGADSVVCVANTEIDEFLSALKSNHQFQMNSPFEQRVTKHVFN